MWSARRRERGREAAGDPGVVDDQGGVRADGGAIGELADPGEEPRREVGAVDPGGGGLAEGLVRGAAGNVVGQRIAIGYGDADEDPAAEPETEMGPHAVGR